MCVNTQNLFVDYDLIRRVNIARANLSITLTEADRFFTIPEQVQKVEQVMKKEINVLHAYEYVRNLEKMRDNAYNKAANNSEELKVLELTFREVQKLSKAFEEYLFKLVEDILKFSTVQFSSTN
jgi:hypothetical protein